VSALHFALLWAFALMVAVIGSTGGGRPRPRQGGAVGEEGRPGMFKFGTQYLNTHNK
jgi:hypothetical protein